MHPVLFQFGFIEIRFYGLMYVVAILVGTALIRREVLRRSINLTKESVQNFIIWVVVSAAWSARVIYYVVFNPGFYIANPAEIPAIWHGGLAIHGGLIGGVSVAFFYSQRHTRYTLLADGRRGGTGDNSRSDLRALRQLYERRRARQADGDAMGDNISSHLYCRSGVSGHCAPPDHALRACDQSFHFSASLVCA